MKKFFVAMMLAVAIVFVVGQSNQAEARRGQMYWGVVVNCNEWITLRSEPSTSAAAITRIPLGARVMIFDEPPRNGFYAVKYNGMNGFALVQYIRSTGEAA